MSIAIQNSAGTQFLSPNGTWTSDRSRALRFDDPLKALAFICGRQLPDAGLFLPNLAMTSPRATFAAASA